MSSNNGQIAVDQSKQPQKTPVTQNGETKTHMKPMETEQIRKWYGCTSRLRALPSPLHCSQSGQGQHKRTVRGGLQWT